MESDSEYYPETVAVSGSGQQPGDTLRAALRVALPDHVIGKVIGTGGVSICFEAFAFASGQPRAIKVSHKGVSPRGSNHLVAVLAEEEASAYAVFDHDMPEPYGIPVVFQSGCLSIDGCEHHYLIMQRLGIDLEALIHQGTISQRTFFQYAFGMLSAVESLHKHSLVHLDVKPRNFCTAYLPTVAPHQLTGRQQVYIIDLEGTRAVPEAGAECQDDDFFGTVDYAGTSALLRKAVGPCDDLESLCYSYLQMWLGRLPWDVTRDFHLQTDVGWAREDLGAMLHLRQQAWEGSCASGKVPAFLQRWHSYALSLSPSVLPNYAFLRRILRSASGDMPTPLNTCPAAMSGAPISRKRPAATGAAGGAHAFARAKRQKPSSPTAAADTEHLLCAEE